MSLSLILARKARSVTFSDKKLALPLAHLTASAAKRREMKRCDKKQEQGAKIFFCSGDGRQETGRQKLRCVAGVAFACFSITDKNLNGEDEVSLLGW